MNSRRLFRRSRLRLAVWYALVMGAILSLCGMLMYRALVQAHWTALEREIESTAGTLHDSLEPMLLPAEDPAGLLQRILPDLCLVGRPCLATPTLIQRHTTGISDRSSYYLRLFDAHGRLLAFSLDQPVALTTTLEPPPWQTLMTESGGRYRQFTTALHGVAHAHTPTGDTHQHPAWGYLQIGRTLATVDAEAQRAAWVLVGGLPLALGLVSIAGWWLSRLAMGPIYRSYQWQQQFTANAAHELRSPLASLLATVEAMQRLPPDSSQALNTLLQSLERQGRRLSQLVADLLLLSRLEQDAPSDDVQCCCLNDVVADLAEEFLERAMALGVRLDQRLPEVEIHVAGHEPQLYRLFSNLLANAMQYTPAGGTVELSLDVEEGMAIVAVRDTGIGIPPEAQARVFERFYRVDSARARNSGGTGLGLAIARAIVQCHRGQLQLDSHSGEGSVFTVLLPVLQQEH